MKALRVMVAAGVGVLMTISGSGVAAQQPARDFDREIGDSVRAAQTAAGFEFLGTLNRLCVLPALGAVNTTDVVPDYVRDPSTVPPRETWYADSARYC
jgi:hypothetical protein